MIDTESLNPFRPVVPPALAATADRGSPWPYVRTELLYLSFALQEVAIITPLALIAMGWARYWPPLQVALLFMLIMLVPFNLIRLMGLAHVSTKWQRRFMLAALLVTVFLSWRILLFSGRPLLDFGWIRELSFSLAEFGNMLWTRNLMLFLFTVLMWWRGMRLAGRPHEINRAGLRLRLGGLIVAPVLVFLTTGLARFSLVPFLLLFFISSLAIVALVRAEQIEKDRSGMGSGLNAGWFAIVALAATILCLAGGLAAIFLSGDSIFVVLDSLSPLWRAFQFGGTVTLIAFIDFISPLLDIFALLIQGLGQILALIFGGISDGINILSPAQELTDPELLTPEGGARFALPPEAGKAAVVAIMVGLLALVAFSMARLYRQDEFAERDGRRSTRSGGDDEGEDLGIVDRLLGRLGMLGRWRAALSIRRIYRHMCEAAAEGGYPRVTAETPYEYLPTLSRAWPDYAAETRLITNAFVHIRYGELPETEEEVEAIRQAWATLVDNAPGRQETEPEDTPRLSKRE